MCVCDGLREWVLRCERLFCLIPGFRKVDAPGGTLPLVVAKVLGVQRGQFVVLEQRQRREHSATRLVDAAVAEPRP